jgi:hypothetical protein
MGALLCAYDSRRRAAQPFLWIVGEQFEPADGRRLGTMPLRPFGRGRTSVPSKKNLSTS